MPPDDGGPFWRSVIDATIGLPIMCAAVFERLGKGYKKPSFKAKDTEYTRFRLEGKYLQAPIDGNATPALVLDCKAEPKRRTSGKMLNAFLVVGNSTVDAHVHGVVLDYRLDGGKIHHTVQGHSTNYSAVALESLVVSDFYYGHMFEHKPNTSPQIQKVVVSVPEYLGGDVVIEFDLGDVTEAAKTCGILLTK